MIQDFVTGLLRQLDPETAHEAALLGLKLGLGPRARADAFPRLRTKLAGLDLPNPIGLAAGFDKNGAVPDAMLAAGFGFVECGTVTPEAQPGNPRPRIFRLTEDRAVINRLGFNNRGMQALLARMRRRKGRPGVVGINVGAMKNSTNRPGEYEAGMIGAWPHASYITCNVSSPNTPGLRGLQERGALEELLTRIDEGRAYIDKVFNAYGPSGFAPPVFLKVAPDLDETAVRDIAEIALAHRLEGLIVSNTTIARPDSLASRYKSEAGGLSGAPLFAPSTHVLKLFAQALSGKLALIGVGGVGSARAALAKIKAGAHAVQLYSALVYEGPSLVARMLAGLDALLAAEGFESVSAAVGVDLR
jgi:dihydroorotate dehydrogenase